jgi:serralysin
LGKDVLTGGAGNDVFVFFSRAESTETAFDRIKDFEMGHDLIDLSGLGYSGVSTAATVEVGELRLI